MVFGGNKISNLIGISFDLAKWNVGFDLKHGGSTWFNHPTWDYMISIVPQDGFYNALVVQAVFSGLGFHVLWHRSKTSWRDTLFQTYGFDVDVMGIFWAYKGYVLPSGYLT